MDTVFDYIIVGAGTAGGTLADRLSASGQHRVLLLEAGKPKHDSLLVRMPAGWAGMTYSPQYSWMHQTEPEQYAGGRRLMMPRGKVVGGSSSINGMIYIRGHRQDYDDWAAAGAAGWGWDDLLPYFIATEDQGRIHNALHGTGGVLPAHDRTLHPTSRAIIDAAVQAGLPEVQDFNDGQPRGVGQLQFNIREGRRVSIAHTAIAAAMARANVCLRTQCLVERVVFEGTRAVGVAYRDARGQLHEVRAQREVLLCAGAIQTPQLLMVSGVGDAAHLRQLGITPVSHQSGVGRNLQDHCAAFVMYRLKHKHHSLNHHLRGLGLLSSVLRYGVARSGPMTTPPAEVCMYLHTDPSLPHPDVQVFGMAMSADPSTGAYRPDGIDKPMQPERVGGLTLSPYQLRPYSRGQVLLKTPFMHDHPALHMNYLHDARDRATLLRALRFLRQLAQQPALQGLIEAEVQPGPDVQSDKEWLQWLAPLLTTGYHPVGTCRMGAEGDALAPCTPDLRVKGVQGLRVVDASVMPNLVCGNTNAAAVVIGAKGADLVLASAHAAPSATVVSATTPADAKLAVAAAVQAAAH